MPRPTISRGRDGEDFVLVAGEPVGVITRGAHGRSTTCTIEGRRTHGANGECRPGEQPAWLVKRARAAGLIGTRHVRRERIPGGLAPAGRCPAGADPREIRQGIRVELEHTRSRAVAREIACDHLTEDRHYYRKLRTARL